MPPETQLLRALPLVLFVALGLSMALTRDPARRRTTRHLFLLYAFGANAFVAVTQTDAWPFSPFRQMATDSRRRDVSTMIAFRALDARGAEWRVESLAWSPLYPPIVMDWVQRSLPTAAPDERDAALAFLLERAEAARRARLAGQELGNRRVLGRFAAPDINLYWQADLAPRPFVALRIYELRWNPRELARDRAAFERRLLLEFRPK